MIQWKHEHEHGHARPSMKGNEMKNLEIFNYVSLFDMDVEYSDELEEFYSSLIRAMECSAMVEFLSSRTLTKDQLQVLREVKEILEQN